MNDDDTAPRREPPSPEALRKIWLGFLYQSIAFLVVLVLVINYVEFSAFRPAWGTYSFGLGILSVLPSIPLLMRFRRLKLGSTLARRSDPDHLKALRQSLVLGVALADLPALMGIIHFFLTADLFQLVLLCLTTVVLIYLYKPPT
jgi:hypothetical protein